MSTSLEPTDDTPQANQPVTTPHGPAAALGQPAAVSTEPAPSLTPTTTHPLGEFAEAIGLDVQPASEHGYGQAVYGSIPVVGNRQPFLILNGGASAAVAETLGSWAAALDHPGYAAVGVALHTVHLRPARKGRVHARAVLVSSDGATALYHIDLHDDAGAATAHAELTVALRPLEGAADSRT